MAFEHTVPPDRLTKQSIAVLGFTDHRVQAFDLPRDKFELWGLNELHRYHPKEVAEGRFSRWFEVHERSVLEPDPEHLKTLGQMSVPVYMHRHWDDIPPSVPFPREVIEQALDSKYFTSSIAWEVAYAVLLMASRRVETPDDPAVGHEEIHVYGVDLAQDQEYFEQRNCLEYWLGVAKGMGIKTYVPATSDLLKAIGQYGFGETASMFAQKVKERVAWLHTQDNDRLAQIRALDAEYQSKNKQFKREYRTKREHLLAERNQIVGAIQDSNYWNQSYAIKNTAPSTSGPSPDRSLDPKTGIHAPSADSGSPEGQPTNRITQAIAEEAA